jgi:N-acyl-D-amino-acid deacylase
MTPRRVSGSCIIDGRGEPFSGHVIVEGTLIREVLATGPAGADPAPIPGVDHLVAVGVGAVIAPGFVDVHSHSDLGLLAAPGAPSKLAQGVTTEIVGNCGFSAFPEPTYWLEPMAKYGELTCFTSAGEYLDHLGRRPLASNVGTLVGGGALRQTVLGNDSGAATDADVRAMAKLAAAAADDGALGISTGAFYRPGCFAETDEVVTVVRAAADHGARFFATHMRDEGLGLLASVYESVRIARDAELPLHISHFKAKGKRSWGTLRHAVDYIAEVDHPVTVDFYPYTASMSSIESFIPQELLALRPEPGDERVRVAVAAGIRNRAMVAEGEGAWSRVVLAHVPGRPELEGRTIDDAAEELAMAPEDVVALLAAESDGRAEIINHCMSPDDVSYVAGLPFSIPATDGYALDAHPHSLVHPRSFGAFPAYLTDHGLAPGGLGLAEAVRRMSAVPAALLGLRRVGRIEAGRRADLLVFEPGAVRAEATYDEPTRIATGFDAIVVGGRLMEIDGAGVRSPAGEVLVHGS